MPMKKLLWCLIALSFLWIGISSAATSSEVFNRAYEEGVITSLRAENTKNLTLTRELVAPFLMNFISNVARKKYSWNLCNANDISIAEEFYQEDLKMLCNFWILRGSNKKINPKRTLSKQEALALVMRIIDGFQEEKKQWHRAYNYYTRARELWYTGVPNIMDSNTLITIEEFLIFLYSTQHPYETIQISKSKIDYTVGKGFKSSWDAFTKLLEIMQD